jgi:putative hydrolase of the HAD superfamily
MPIPVAEVDVWVFDLDNTLYSPLRSDLMPQMHLRMQEFIMAEFAVDEAEADRRRQFFYEQYGTTLRGLMEHHGMDPEAFLPYCHQLDLSEMLHDAMLDAALDALPGRKVVYTNATQAHAKAVMERLGIGRHFDGVFDIADAAYLPKPNAGPYEIFAKRFDIDPRRAAMFEDTAKNLKPAHDMGMRTIWMRNDRPAAQPESEADEHIHFIVDDLADFLAEIVAGNAAEAATST